MAQMYDSARMRQKRKKKSIKINKSVKIIKTEKPEKKGTREMEVQTNLRVEDIQAKEVLGAGQEPVDRLSRSSDSDEDAPSLDYHND